MENEMNFKRVMMILLAAMLLPGMALAQTTTRATFLVWKNFSDNNDASVEVTLDCFTGLPITQSQTITDGKNKGVTFIVESFKSGELDCVVSEEDVTGYTADFSECGKAGAFGNVEAGEGNECEIINRPDPVEVTVTKDWEVDGAGGNALDPTYSLTLVCNNEIKGGENDKGTWYKDLTDYGTGDTKDTDYTAHVVPDWDGGTDCWVDEKVYDSSVEVDNGCAEPEASPSAQGSEEESPYPLNVEIGDADDANGCTIVNTVFYEGIPTLSQYGMAIMALLMLGVGFVGFRRFA
jgi:IPTL-CTERM motif